MSQPQPPTPPRPPHPITAHHVSTKPASFPELILATVSVLFLFSSSAATTSSPSSQAPKIPFLPFPIKPRRFPRGSISMSAPSRHPFPTPQSLSDWLGPRLPSGSLASWGAKPGTKNVHNLWLELAEGEISLADSTPPVRTLHVVTVRVVRNGRVLVEARQELSDGSFRDRFRPLSEKMKPGETPEAAAIRAVTEELGSVLDGGGEVRIIPGTYRETVEERHSVSYPGLPARYLLHSMDAVVDGLPEEEEFVTEEAEEYSGDSEDRREAKDRAVSVRRHFWQWVSPDSSHDS